MGSKWHYQNEPLWSRSEKALARKDFDAALGRDLHEVIQEAKKMANQIQRSSDLWNLEHNLTECRKETDRKSKSVTEGSPLISLSTTIALGSSEEEELMMS